MTDEYELPEIKKRDATIPPHRVGESGTEVVNDGAVNTWAYAATISLLALALPMILFPRVLLFLSETASERRNTLTPLESFLSMNLGILLVALAFSILFSIPTNPLYQVSQQATPSHPLLIPLSTACNLIALISYNTRSVSSLAFVVFLCSITIGIWGLWTIMFAGSSSRSRKTGADKHTSSFLFGNVAAASAQKKAWRREQAQG